MIIEFKNIWKILPSELIMITKIYKELEEARSNYAFIGNPNFVVSNNEEKKYLEINIKIQRPEILKNFNCSITTEEK